jgi:hypothetical protein
MTQTRYTDSGIMNTRLLYPATLIFFALLLASCSDTTLLFQVQDSVSGGWVWDVTAHLQGRSLTSYYQTDAGPIAQKLSHLKPGPAPLSLSAPGYQPVTVPLTLRGGKNRLQAPIAMVGREIPGLAGFSIFETAENGDFGLQLRPLDAAGKAIINHPCIDLWVGCVVSEQVSGGVPVRAEGFAGAARGETLFRGIVPWTWDAKPESLFRYVARISSADMAAAASLYRVIDYLIVVPDPLKITRAEVQTILAGAWSSGGLIAGNPSRSQPAQPSSALTAALASLSGRARFFLVTSWDVRARRS